MTFLRASDLTSYFLGRVYCQDNPAGHVLSRVVDTLEVVEKNLELFQAHCRQAKVEKLIPKIES